MGSIITIAIHKGGTGKTVVSLNLAFFATLKLNKKVLLVDLDVQGNASYSLQKGMVDNSGCLTSSMLFKESLGSDKLPVNLSENLDLIPPDDSLNGVERYPLETAMFFKKHLQKIAANYDLVIVDTPPTMGFAMLAPLMVSDFALSPIVPDDYSFEGAKNMFQKVKAIKNKENPSLNFLGLLINRWNRTNPDQNKKVNELHSKLSQIVLEREIAEKTAIAKAASTGVPVWYRPSGGAARQTAKETMVAIALVFKKMGFKL